jgi:hypothetical protein
MERRQFLGTVGALACAGTVGAADKGGADAPLPEPGKLTVSKPTGEVILPAVVQHPKDKPCLDDWGQRVQAFAGCSKAAGGEAKMLGYFVFVADLSAEDVYDALVRLGAKTRVHYSMEEGRKRSGLKPTTTPDDYLQGDPVTLSVFWKDGAQWVERPYQDFARERVQVGEHWVEKPWTPSFVFHGSGALHQAGTGCIACPCDCAGGLIADNRYPLYDPKPTVKFNWELAPAVGTLVYVRIRPVLSR